MQKIKPKTDKVEKYRSIFLKAVNVKKTIVKNYEKVLTIV